jgi:hypothetical protein
MFSLYGPAVTLIAGKPSALVHDIRNTSQLFGMVYRVLGLEVCAQIVFRLLSIGSTFPLYDSPPRSFSPLHVMNG